MAHGIPDWGLVAPRRVTYGLDDLGEHAVRVGAVPSWDRRGVVVFSDSFVNGLNAWRVTTGGAGAYLTLRARYALSPPYCAWLRTGDAPGAYASMTHALGYVFRGRVGLECNLTVEIGAEFVVLGIFESTAQGQRMFYVRLTPATGLLEYGSDAAGWTAFGNVDAVWGNVWEWRNAKLVVDFETGSFVKFVWQGTVIDMDGIMGLTAAPTLSRYWMTMIRHSCEGDVPKTVMADDVIVTIDEP